MINPIRIVNRSVNLVIDSNGFSAYSRDIVEMRKNIKKAKTILFFINSFKFTFFSNTIYAKVRVFIIPNANQ